MADERVTLDILTTIDNALDQMSTWGLVSDTDPLTCPRSHGTEHLFYRKPFRGAPDTILDCRICYHDNITDAQNNPEPSDLYEN